MCLNLMLTRIEDMYCQKPKEKDLFQQNNAEQTPLSNLFKYRGFIGSYESGCILIPKRVLSIVMKYINKLLRFSIPRSLISDIR